MEMIRIAILDDSKRGAGDGRLLTVCLIIEMTSAPILASAGQLALEKVTTQEKKLTVGTESFNMPLKDEYEPSPSERVRRQVESYEATNGALAG